MRSLLSLSVVGLLLFASPVFAQSEKGDGPYDGAVRISSEEIRTVTLWVGSTQAATCNPGQHMILRDFACSVAVSAGEICPEKITFRYQCFSPEIVKVSKK